MATLLGEWGFLDNLDDTSGNGHTATASGFTPSFVDGPSAGTRAVVLNTATARIAYGRAGLEPAQADGGIVTMAWVKLNASHSQDSEVVAKMRVFDSTRHSIRNTNDVVSYMARWRDRLEYPPFGTGVGDLSDLGWHHVCLVDADDRWELYFDGVSITGGGAASGTLEAWQDFPWCTGYNPDASNQAPAIDMSVTAVRIFSGTMTVQEVATWKGTFVGGSGGLLVPSITGTDPELTQITVHWTPIGGAAGYRLLVDGTEWPGAGLITGTSYTISGLTQGQVYEFKVIAEDDQQVQSDPSDPVTERASMIVSSTQCVVSTIDDPNTDATGEWSLAFLPGGSPGDPDLGWHSNGRTGELFWWERTDPPRVAVYPYLGPWTDGLTIQKESGDTVRVIEWVRGMDAWRETDIATDGDTLTVDHSDLTMNAGSGPVGGATLDCTLLEHAGDAAGWTVRLWNYHPVAATSEGTFSGSTTWTGTFTGEIAAEGTFSGSTTWAGAFTGSNGTGPPPRNLTIFAATVGVSEWETTAPETTWTVTPTENTWSATPPETTWSTTGATPMSIRADSTEYRPATVTTSHDLTGVAIEVAFPPTGTAPETWYPTSVLSVAEAAGKWTARYRILIGPDGGAVTLPVGTYDWTTRIQDNPETPVLAVGKFQVTER